MEAAFAWHHFSHAHNDLTTGNVLSGFDAKKMAKSQRSKTKKTAPKKTANKSSLKKSKK
jgi:enoyl-CoA hydratase